MPKNEVILFEPDGYVLDGPKLMGRQAAGHAFLRAAVAGRSDGPMRCLTPSQTSAEIFARLLRSLDPKATAEWVRPGRLELLAASGTLYVPGPVLAEHARMRLRANSAAYSLVGVTHTTASHGAMDSIAELVSEPLMPWDALICTSDAVLETVKTILGARREYLSWRFGAAVTAPEPMLPVIPLGVHCGDFSFSDAERREAREALNIAPGQVVGLFVGRLSYHAKAHPHAMYLGLERAVQATGKSIALVQCGWFANEPIERAFKEGARRYAPSITALYTNGKNEAERRRSWAAADFFVSLSDNVQETFGLTPIEAMAAGLPSIVSDWDGYKDTVRDGEDGFRIPTAMPEAGNGNIYALAHEAGEATYDHYSGLVCRHVAVDLDALTARISDLVTDRALAQRLGHQARQRARSVFDWPHIYRRYQSIYAELAERRGAALRDPARAGLTGAPAVSATRLDPFHAFAHYPTHALGPTSRVALAPDARVETYSALAADPLYSYLPTALPGDKATHALLTALANGPRPIDALAGDADMPVTRALLALSTLMKMGLVKRVG